MKKIKVLAKIVGGLISFILLIILFLVLYVEFNKESITRYVISVVNNNINGEVSIKGVNFNPIAQFPYQSISLNDVIVLDSEMNTVISSERIYLAINVFSLFRDTAQIYGLELENAKFDIIKTKDNNINLLEVFSANRDATESGKSNLLESGLIPEKIVLDNVLISYKPKDEVQNWSYFIDHMDTYYNLHPDTIDFSIGLSSRIIRLPVSKTFIYDDKDLKLESEVRLISSDSSLRITTASLIIDNTLFDLKGSINFSGKKKSKLEFSLVDDHGLASILNLENASKDFIGGTFDISGTLEYDPIVDLPIIMGSVEISDLSIVDLKSGSSLNNINLSGQFCSGTDTTMLNSKILLDTLYYTSGYEQMRMKILINDLRNPHLMAEIEGMQDINIFSNVFDLPDMEGEVTLSANIDGSFDNNSWKSNGHDTIFLGFKGVSVDLGEDIPLKNFFGSVAGTLNKLKLDGLSFMLGSSDYTIDGYIDQLPVLISDTLPAKASLEIRSGFFNLAELLEWIPNADAAGYKESFPYDFKDIFVSVSTSLSSEKFKEFRIMPEFRIDVSEAVATIDQFLPPVKVSNGWLEFVVPDSILLIDIREFDIITEDNTLSGGCTYFSRPGINDSLIVDANIESLSPGFLLNYYDSVAEKPEYYNTISGEFDIGMNFSGFDTLVDKRFLSAEISDLQWRMPQDTLVFSDIQLTLDSIYYNTNAILGPLSKVSGKAEVDISGINSSWIDLKKLDFIINAVDGVFSLNVVESTSLFNAGTGELVLAPFIEQPFFNFEYQIDSLQFEEFYERLNQSAAIKGKVNASIRIKGKGVDKKKVASSVNGTIKLDGHNLQLIGLNLDEVIRKINRTQNFNLTDVGALVVAGPVGLLVTKGSDLTSLLMINREDSTGIIELVSEWNVENGKLELSDVAFSTPKNRIAVKGDYSFVSDSVSIVVAVIDDKGHIQLHQTIYGERSNPKFSAIKPIRSLLKPVENLLVEVLMLDGDVFYDGKVVAPSQKK